MIALLVSLFAGPVQAQRGEDVFLEPDVRATQFFDESAIFTGLRLGGGFDGSKFSYDFGLDVLTGSSLSGGGGTQTPVTVRRLGRISVAIRYNSLLMRGLHYDIGAALKTGLSEGEVRQTRDVRSTPGPYLGMRPEVGVLLGILDELGIRFNAGYSLGAFINAAGNRGISLGAGLRIQP